MEATANLQIRPWQSTDSVEDLTLLLHRAYAGLAAMGLRYMATHQSADTTRERIERGECFVVTGSGVLLGTAVFYPAARTRGCPWYDREEVASFGQFAVDPGLQRGGIGSRLLATIEQRATETGAAELALDTAEPATNLVGWYTRLGYRFIEHMQWSHTNYRSVILSKTLAGQPSRID